MLGTLEMISARRKEVFNNVELSQLLNVSDEINGMLKSLT
jgi:hypothetical protein